jgi:hypothetical protein
MRVKRRDELPWLYYPRSDQVIINSHRFGLTLDADAADFISRVETADAASLETAVKIAFNTFIVGIKTDAGVSTLASHPIKAACIMAGARTLAGALVPLVGPAPTNVGGNFVSGDYDRETGLIGNGTSKQLDSNRANNADPQNDFHASVWASSISTGFMIGAGASGGRTSISSGAMRCRTSGASFFTAPSSGILAMSRASAANYQRRYGATSDTATVTSTTPVSDSIAIFANSGNTQYTASRLAWYSIGESIDLALLDSRLSTLMTDLANAI